MKNTFFLLVTFSILFSCRMNSIIGRSQLSLVPESEMQSTALTERKSFLSQNKVAAAGNGDAAMVRPMR